ncbi:hypothetical protein EDB86DRAFT_2953417 [Lactarius hatsudake]|nr:hypothetical protein EDB86DRAFT_2953417 [Lactarius hatsudake]
MDHRRLQPDNRASSFSLRVICNVFDRQVNCAAQICNALRPVLSGVEQLTLVDGLWMPADWEDSDIDDVMWHKLFRTFIGAKRLHTSRVLRWEIAHALQTGDAGLDPGLDTDNLFSSFIDARQVAGRSVRLLSSSVPHARRPRRRFPPLPRDFWELPYIHEPFRYLPLLAPWDISHLWREMQDILPVQPVRNLPVPYVPPVRVEPNSPLPSRPTHSVGIQYPPPKHIRSRLRPSHKGAGSAWR